jgi:hypothetical protein
VRFNDEFLPSWRPSYLVHEAPTASPQAFVGVLQAEGNLPELRQLRRPRETALPQTVAGFVRDGAGKDGRTLRRTPRERDSGSGHGRSAMWCFRARPVSVSLVVLGAGGDRPLRRPQLLGVLLPAPVLSERRACPPTTRPTTTGPPPLPRLQPAAREPLSSWRLSGDAHLGARLDDLVYLPRINP